MHKARGILLLLAAVTVLFGLPTPASAAPVITRPVAELFGTEPGYGIAGVGVGTATGNYTISATDIAGSDDDLGWTRTYNSLDTRIGPLGRGWSFEYGAHLTVLDGGAVAFTRGDGRVFTFVPDNGGYRRPLDLAADLLAAAGGEFSLRFDTGAIWTFDATGRAIARADAGQVVTFTYDAEGRLVTVQDSAGRQLRLAYHGSRLAKVTNWDGGRVIYTYDHNGDLISVTRPDGTVNQYFIRVDGPIAKAVDGAGQSVAISYDEGGRVTAQRLSDGQIITFVYHDEGGVTRVIDGVGHVVVYQHDANGRLISPAAPATLTSPLGG